VDAGENAVARRRHGAVVRLAPASDESFALNLLEQNLKGVRFSL
jgi:hypothetical protein